MAGESKSKNLQKGPPITSPQLAKAGAHPLRVRLMAFLTVRSASPSELADELNEPLNVVCYHVKVLRKLNCIELVQVEDAQGGRVAKHVYRATIRLYMSTDAFDVLTDVQKHAFITTLMGLISEDVDKAMHQGTFFDPDDNHLTRTPMTVDRQGWQESIAILDTAVEELLEVSTRSAVRMSESGETPMQQKVEIIHFRSPDRT